MEEITAGWEGEFHGVRVAEFFRSSGRKSEGESEALRNMYGCFYAEICATLSGKRAKFATVGAKEGMESILFLSSCITSNMHSNSWVEIDYGVASQMASFWTVCWNTFSRRWSRRRCS